jgi:phosphomevalonate kinase
LTRSVVASAPGKLVILGEYAVLEGGPCLVAAVNRRATVTLQETQQGIGQLTAWMPLEHHHRFTPDGPSELELVDQLRDALGLTERLFDGTLDTRPFFDPVSGEKLGVGSSAALSCAFWAALTRLAGSEEKLALAELDSLRVKLQGGAGSGVDLAASFAGGCQRFQRPEGEDEPTLQALPWPVEVAFTAVFSGYGAVTADFLAQYRRWSGQAGKIAKSLLERLAGTAEAGCQAAAEGQGSAFVRALDRYGALMGELGEAMGKPIVTPTHQRLAEVARSLGGAYKPSGAGGGDVGIAGFTDPQALLAFTGEVETLGLTIPELGIDSQGLIVEQQEI